MRRERQAAEHDDGLHDVIVDLETVFCGERAALDRQIVQLAEVGLLRRQHHVKAPKVGRVANLHRRFAGTPGHDVFRPVCQQGLIGGQGARRHIRQPPQFGC